MVNEDIELVTIEKSSNKKSLLERYDIPIENLSYEYITQCTQVKELERIVLILRSGEEGIYPDLTKHAEERLAVIKPQSAVLRVAAPILTKEMLEPENRKILENDINEWMIEMKLREKDLKEGRATLINETNNSEPDIRQIKFNETKKKQQSQNKQECKRISGCDYAGWDKYDADTEINRIDIQSERKQAETKRNQQKIHEKEEKIKKASREATINKRTLTETELRVLAEGEKEKGNEAFKAGDYEEALQFYNSSISIDGTINGYNNRAITFVKLQRYNEAINDCNIVISMDERNIKALLRRGLAFEHLEKRSEALSDYEAVLKLEPTNKTAISALNKLRQPCNSKKIRMKIEEEIKETDKEHEEKSIENRISNVRSDYHNLKSFKSTSKIPPQVCFCNNAPCSSRHSSPRPHIREAYCTDPKKKSIDSPKSRSIYADTKIYDKKSSVVIEEISNESVEKVTKNYNFTTTNFGVGDNKEIGKKSSIFIEEIPSESENEKNEDQNYNFTATNFGVGDNKKIGKKSSVIIKEIDKKSATIIDETSRRVSENSEKILNSKLSKEKEKKLSDKNNDNINNVDCVIVNEQNGISNMDFSKDKNYHKIKSPYEFIKVWHSIKTDPDLFHHAILLKALAPENIDIVIGNKLDGQMLSTILRCLEKNFSQDVNFLHRFLQSLAKVQRFSLVTMFMDANDRQVLQKIFSMLEMSKVSQDDIEDLRKDYELS